jgi:hypothetical protein
LASSIGSKLKRESQQQDDTTALSPKLGQLWYCLANIWQSMSLASFVEMLWIYYLCVQPKFDCRILIFGFEFLQCKELGIPLHKVTMYMHSFFPFSFFFQRVNVDGGIKSWQVFMASEQDNDKCSC